MTELLPKEKKAFLFFPALTLSHLIKQRKLLNILNHVKHIPNIKPPHRTLKKEVEISIRTK